MKVWREVLHPRGAGGRFAARRPSRRKASSIRGGFAATLQDWAVKKLIKSPRGKVVATHYRRGRNIGVIPDQRKAARRRRG